jgi:hypothetical protein
VFQQHIKRVTMVGACERGTEIGVRVYRIFVRNPVRELPLLRPRR